MKLFCGSLFIRNVRIKEGGTANVLSILYESH